jgi:hypothetical protein
MNRPPMRLGIPKEFVVRLAMEASTHAVLIRERQIPTRRAGTALKLAIQKVSTTWLQF